MRQLDLPLYGPTLPAPERAILSILHSTLAATEAILRDEHPALDDAPAVDDRYAPLVIAAAHLIVRRAAELRSLLVFYDQAVDEVVSAPDGSPF